MIFFAEWNPETGELFTGATCLIFRCYCATETEARREAAKRRVPAENFTIRTQTINPETK